ncbi:hypothetical protein Ndes2437B_g03436 [Nannochloris sp. 'desiccata']
MGHDATNWRETGWLIESHKLPLYGVAFNYCNVEHRDLFATTGSSKAIVYRCLPDGSIKKSSRHSRRRRQRRILCLPLVYRCTHRISITFISWQKRPFTSI